MHALADELTFVFITNSKKGEYIARNRMLSALPYFNIFRLKSRSLNEEVSVVLIGDVVAMEVTLNVFNQRLEIEVWQLVHYFKHDVLEEFLV